MSRMARCLTICIFATVMLTVAYGAERPEYKYPFLRVPRVEQPPKMDGVIHADEYRQMAALTGMVRWGGGGPQGLVPKLQQVVWYIGYKDGNMYLSMRSPQAEGTWPKSRTKKRDAFMILADDHTEIQFAPHGREHATDQGKGFYKIMTTPRGNIGDAWHYNGTPGTEKAWSYGGELKCNVTEEHWDMEMRIPVESFQDVQKFAGERWVAQFLRADSWGGVYFAGWIGAPWMAWDRFGEIEFDPDAPALQFTEMGNVTRGKMNLRMAVAGSPAGASTVSVTVRATNGENEQIYKETQSARIGSEEREQMRFADQLKLTDAGNQLEVYATYQLLETEEESPVRTLYRVRMPVVKMTDKLWAQFIEPWLERRPAGKPDYRFAYWPSYGVARVSADVDFFGMDPAVAGASALESIVRRRDNGKTLARRRIPLDNKGAQMVLEVGELREGKYEALLRLYGANGKKVVHEKNVPFVRKHYPWEGNEIGEKNIVVPPFEPIQVEDMHLKPWNRDYQIGASGLPEQIVAGGGGGPEGILRGPVRLEAKVDGKTIKAEPRGKQPDIRHSTDARVDLTARSDLGPASVELESFMEYDGWYQVTIAVAPGEKGATLDELEMVIPLWGAADTMYVQRSGDGFSGNRFGAIPEGEGTVWRSTELFGTERNSYVPIIFLGTGDKGLWCFVEEFRDWAGDPGESAVQVVRPEGGGVNLRVRFFAAPVELGRERHITFALLADPAKPTVDPIQPERHWRRMAWGWNGEHHGGVYQHDTSGYRYWGGSVDGYENTDEDLDALRRFMEGEFRATWRRGKHVQGRFTSATEKGAPIVLYGSTSLTGLGLPAFDTYGGEWIGRTNWGTNPASKFKGLRNYQGTVTWDTPREMSVTGVNFTDSYMDCFVWYHMRLIENVPVNGTWWDNASLTRITDYDPEREEFYTRYNVFTRRRLMKRLITAQYERDKRPLWINNMHVDWPFCQVSWHIENEFYIDSNFNTMQDHLSVDKFRAMCRIKRGIIHRLATRSPGGPSIHMEQLRNRSIVGMCLLHDIGTYRWGSYAREMRRMPGILHEKVGFFDGAQFIGYWRSGNLVEIGADPVYASVYQGKGRAVIVVLNESRDPVDVPFEIRPDILPDKKEISRVYDAETGYAFGQHWDKKQHRREWGEYHPGVFGIEGGGVRLIAVE